MVPAEYAGVLFTEHPAVSGACAVELVAGLGDDLVSGRVDPMSFRFGRTSGRLHGERTPPIDLAPLLELGRKVEALFGRPQDIEWAYARGRFFLLQARDVTRLCTHGVDAPALRERERARLLELARGAQADDVVFAQNELSELLPEPTPFSLEWMEEMWAYGGSTDLASACSGHCTCTAPRRSDGCRRDPAPSRPSVSPAPARRSSGPGGRTTFPASCARCGCAKHSTSRASRSRRRSISSAARRTPS